MTRLPLALLGTIDPLLRDAVTLTAALEPGTVVVRHDLLDDEDGDGRIRRVVSDVMGVIEDVVVPLEHACVSCAVREDAIPTLRRLAELGRWTQAVLALPVSAESLPVARTLAPQTRPGGTLPQYRISCVVAAVDVGRFAADVLEDDLLAERSLGVGVDDRRGVGEAVVALAEHADVVVTSGEPDATGTLLLEHLRAADGRLVEGVHGLDAAVLFGAHHDPAAGEARAELDRDPTHGPVEHLAGRAGPGARGDEIVTLRLTSDRAFDPDRLLDRIEELGAGPLRSRGVFWVPTRPDSVVGWEGCGGQLSVGELGVWGSDTPRTDLTFTGRARDLLHLAQVFDDVLLTDIEVDEGLGAWLGRHDVLVPWLGERSLG